MKFYSRSAVRRTPVRSKGGSAFHALPALSCRIRGSVVKQDNPPRGILPRRNLCAACIAIFASPWYRAAKRQAVSPPEETQNTPPDRPYHRTSRYYSTFVTVLQDFFRHALENSMILYKNKACNLCISMKIHRDFWHEATSICNFLKKQHGFCHRLSPAGVSCFRKVFQRFITRSANKRHGSGISSAVRFLEKIW